MGGGGRRKAEWSYVVREAEVRRVSWGDITRAGTETKMRLRYATSLFKGRTALKPLAQMGQTVTPRVQNAQSAKEMELQAFFATVYSRV